MENRQNNWEQDLSSRVRPAAMDEGKRRQLVAMMDGEAMESVVRSRLGLAGASEGFWAKCAGLMNAAAVGQDARSLEASDEEWASDLASRVRPAPLGARAAGEIAEMMAGVARMEVRLAALKPAEVGDGLKARLEDAMEGFADDEFEGMLKSKLRPAELSPFAGGRLVARMNAAGRASERGAGWGWKRIGGIAAVLGVAGVVLGLMDPMGGQTGSELADANSVIIPGQSVSAVAKAAEAHDSFKPNAERRAVRVANEGVVWSQDRAPHQCLRVDYVDKVKVSQPDGTKLEMSRPTSGYIYVPVDVD